VQDVFDIYTIIFLALAVFIFLRLRSVLGQRTGRERPPYDPYSPRDAVRGATNDNVVTRPGRDRRRAKAGRKRRAGRALEGNRRSRLDDRRRARCYRA
jgi:predicted lipid-binding transport protein (Tim44 family)